MYDINYHASLSLLQSGTVCDISIVEEYRSGTVRLSNGDCLCFLYEQSYAFFIVT